MELESELERWQRELPGSFQLHRKEQTTLAQSSPQEVESSRFSTVLTLRYLSTRMLLHRATLEKALEGDPQKQGAASRSVFLQDFERSSMNLCLASAVDLIDIHYNASESKQPMLTTWWFSLFYGKIRRMGDEQPIWLD